MNNSATQIVFTLTPNTKASTCEKFLLSVTLSFVVYYLLVQAWLNQQKTQIRVMSADQ